MLCDIFQSCGYCTGASRHSNIKESNNFDEEFLFDDITPNKAVISFNKTPDIHITPTTKCTSCQTIIQNKKYVSVCNHTVFFFCKEFCYLKWLNNKPVMRSYNKESNA